MDTKFASVSILILLPHVRSKFVFCLIQTPGPIVTVRRDPLYYAGIKADPSFLQ